MAFGSYSNADAGNPQRREEIYRRACDLLVDLAAHAKARGLTHLLIEPVPLATEFPSSAGDALRLMQDLDGNTEIPVRLLVDWGHALFRPLFGDEADMDHWMATCGRYIHSFHIQQTDGDGDRHWNFTRDGIVTPAVLKDFWDRHGLTDQTLFMEITYPFEERDDVVLDEMVRSAALLKAAA